MRPRRARRASAVDVVDEHRRARARSCRVGVRSTSGMRGCSGPKSMPCGFASSCASVRPSGSAPKPSPYGPVRSMKSSMRSGPRRDASSFSSSSASRPSTFDPCARHGLLHEARDHEVVERVEVGVGTLAARGSPPSRSRICHSAIAPGSSSIERRRVVGDVADREVVERDVVVAARELGLGREDHVGVARRLVEVDVDAHHELERRRARGRAGRESGVESTGLPAIVISART